MLDNPREMLNSPLFVIINTCLEGKGCYSSIAALFCDIIQKSYFAQYDLFELSPHFHYAIEALYANDVEGLRKITAIAFLKEFVHKFWDDLIQDGILQPIELNFDFFDLKFIDQINGVMDLPYESIHSLKIYFLRDLRNRGYFMDDVKKFSKAQENTLPWLKPLFWDNNQEIRLQFNIYYSFEDYYTVEDCFSFFYNYNSKEQFSQFFNKISKEGETNARISFMGGTLNRLHVIRAIREWLDVENQAAEFLNKKVQNIDSLSNIYKNIIKVIITNQHSILHLDTNVSNTDLLIKSVIGHVIALHSSLSSDASLLAYLLHNLGNCNDYYILACPSDEESIMLSEAFKVLGNITR